MRKVAITGIGHTVFGNLSDFDLVDIMTYVSCEALDDAGTRKNKNLIDQIDVSNMGGGVLNQQIGIASSLVRRLNLEPAIAELMENESASGGSAAKIGYSLIASGFADVVMITVEELMKQFTKKEPIIISGIGSATDTHCVHISEDPLETKAVCLSGERAFKMANLSPSDISFAELCDAFIILEMAISEEPGFLKG